MHNTTGINPIQMRSANTNSHTPPWVVVSERSNHKHDHRAKERQRVPGGMLWRIHDLAHSRYIAIAT